MAENEIKITILADDEATPKLKKAADAAEEVRDRGGSGLNAFREIGIGALRAVGEAAVAAMATAGQAVAGFIQDSIGAAANFESGMNTFKSAAGDMGQAELGEFKDLFLSLGKELPVSTQEVQDAATAMVKGGIDPATLAAGALKDTLLFAAAAGMDLTSAADLSAKQLGTFVDMTASAAEKTAFLTKSQELLVKAANASTLDVSKLGDAMLGAAGQAATMQLDYQDFVTTMGLISPSFASAAEAGTSFKNFLARIQPSTKPAIAAMKELGLITKDNNNLFFDAEGRYVGGAKAAQLLKDALDKLSPAEQAHYMQTIFGNDAMGSAAALMRSGASGYDAFAAAMNNANGIQATAANTQQGLNFAMENMKGSVEALQITLGTVFLPLLSQLVSQFTTGLNVVIAFVENFIKLAPALGEGGNVLQTFVNILAVAASAAIPGAGAAVYDFWSKIQPTIAAVQSLVGQAIALGQAFITWVTPYAMQLANAFTTQIIPAAMAVWQIFTTQIIPILMNLAPIVQALVEGALQLFASYWTNVLVPAISAVWSFITTNLLPILAQLASWLGANLPPIIQSLAGFLSNTLFPAINTIATYVSGTLIPAIMNLAGTAFVNWINKVIEVTSKLASALKPAIDAVQNAVSGPLSKAMQEIQPVLSKVGEIAGTVAGAFGGIAKAIGDAIGKVKSFIDQAAKIKVPPLVTPGSPTPLELGFRGITDAISQAALALPSFNMGLAAVPASVSNTIHNTRVDVGGMAIYADKGHDEEKLAEKFSKKLSELTTGRRFQK